MRCVAEDRSSAAICWIASDGIVVPASASRITSMIAAIDLDADDDPRKSTALPAFMQIAAASAVTFGRPS